MLQEAKTYRMAARLFGAFFILAFLSYGIGSGLVASVSGNADGLAGVFANKTTLMIGVILMAIVHSLANVSVALLMFRVLKIFSRVLAYGYLAACIMATMTAVVGALFLMLLSPLSDAYVAAGTDTAHFGALASVLTQGGFYGYQLSMTIWGIGGLALCYVLFVSRLVPRVLPIWGALGYVIFMIGTIAEIFGYGIGVMLSAPGGLFELGLSFWLIFKGFSIPALSAQQNQQRA